MAEHLYKVNAGDTVFTICMSNGISFDKFIKLNPQFGELGHRSYDHLVEGEIVVVDIDGPDNIIKYTRRL